MTDEFTPTIIKIKTQIGIAGQYGYMVTVQYPNERPMQIEFVGSTYGGPIIMNDGVTQTFIDPAVTERCGGELSPDWIRKFYS